MPEMLCDAHGASILRPRRALRRPDQNDETRTGLDRQGGDGRQAPGRPAALAETTPHLRQLHVRPVPRVTVQRADRGGVWGDVRGGTAQDLRVYEKSSPGRR